MTELQKICKTILDEYVHGQLNVGKSNYSKIYQLGYKFGQVLYLSPLVKDDFEMMLETVVQVAKKEKNTSQVLEGKILDALSFYVDTFCTQIEEEVQGFPKLTLELVEAETDKKHKNYHKVALRIKQLTEDLLAVKKGRDAFSGKRKKYVLEMLMSLSDVYEVDGIEEIFVMGLKAKGRDLSEAVLDAMPIYYKDKEVSEKIIELVKKRVSKAKGKSELVSCLHALSKLNIIGEFEIMNEVEEWEERHYY